MSRMFIPLEDVRVASPCHADWDMMDGNDRSRYCGSCTKNVYNLSEMTRVEAEALIAEKEGHLCVRYYQRADGTIMTQDCPVGVAKIRRAVLMPLRWSAVGAMTLVAWGMMVLAGGKANGRALSPSNMPFYAAVMDRLYPQASMGDVAMSPSSTPPTVTMGTPPVMGKPVYHPVGKHQAPTSNKQKAHVKAKSTKRQSPRRTSKQHVNSGH